MIKLSLKNILKNIYNNYIITNNDFYINKKLK